VLCVKLLSCRLNRLNCWKLVFIIIPIYKKHIITNPAEETHLKGDCALGQRLSDKLAYMNTVDILFRNGDAWRLDTR